MNKNKIVIFTFRCLLSQMEKSKLELYVDPLGDLYVEWVIPLTCIKDNCLQIDLPTYKYEMSNFLGVPIPIASIAEILNSEVFKVETTHAEGNRSTFRIIDNWQGRKTLKICILNNVNLRDERLKVQYKIKNLVTKDKVFFNFVYTMFNPLPLSMLFDIKLKVHFAYHISHHRFKTVLINENTGRIMFDTGFIKHQRIGDYIYATGDSVSLPTNGTIDMHVHGSRLPFAIDRRYFWIVVYIVTLVGFGGIISAYTYLIKSILDLFQHVS